VLYVVNLVVVSASIVSSCALIVCYAILVFRSQQNPLLNLSPHLSVITSISFSNSIYYISLLYPLYSNDLLTEENITNYSNTEWPEDWYFLIPLNTFGMGAAWFWLAILPYTIHWTALSQPGQPSPVELINKLHKIIWPFAIFLAILESIILFVIPPDIALSLHFICLASIGIVCVIFALVKYTKFSAALNEELAATADYIVPSSSNLGEDEPRIYMGSLLKRALLYLFSFVIIWGPVFLANLSCAIHECDELGIRIQILISCLQGFLLLLIFWYQEDIKGLLCRRQVSHPPVDEDMDYYPEYVLPSASNLQKLAMNGGYDLRRGLERGFREGPSSGTARSYSRDTQTHENSANTYSENSDTGTVDNSKLIQPHSLSQGHDM